MAKDIISLTIEKLAGLGDGMGLHSGRKVYVPYTLAGDVVRAEIVRKTADADYARLVEVVTPSPNRAVPVCKHFGICGGCSLQHLHAQDYAAFKHGIAAAAVRKAGYDPAVVAPLVTLPAASRRRAEFKVERGKLGFYAQGSHLLVDLEECHVLEKELLALILRLKPHLVKLQGLTSVQVNGVDGGYDILLGGVTAAALPPDPIIRRVTPGLRASAPVTVTLSGIPVEVPPGAFLQASLQAQEIMIARIAEATKGATSVLDLFCGIGTYSFALAQHASVTAAEGDSAMSDAVRVAAKKHGLPVKALTRDLFRTPFTAKELAAFGAAVINPPRTGAKEQCAQLALAKIPRLAMVSCNPATFARDARLLHEGNYRLTRLTPIDQFVYSSHLELVAEFSR